LLVSVILHIGPPKTASTSLQKHLIPRMGLPYQIKPPWSRQLARDAVFELPEISDHNLLLSDEELGHCFSLPAKIVSERLSQIFSAGAVIWIKRNPLEWFISIYRQYLFNQLNNRQLAIQLAEAHPASHSPNHIFRMHLDKLADN